MVTANIRELMKAALTEAAPAATGVHFGAAPSSAEFLYLVFSLEEVSHEDNLSLQEMEVDVVDYGENTEPAETAADQISAALDHRYILTDDLQASVYRERRQPLYETDKNVIKRRLTFQIRLHERSN